MKLGFKAKAVFAMAALAIGGAAHANTSINESTTGSLILNVVDSVSGLSFVFDTGLSQSTFDQNAFYQFNVTSDANYQAFTAGAGSNQLLYNIISADNQNPGATTEDNALSTIVNFSGTTRNTNLNNAMTYAENYAVALNSFSTPSTNSVYVNNVGDAANFATFSAGWAGLQATFSGAVGTALQFYSINFNGTLKTSPSLAAIRTALAQTWLFDNGVLTYGTQTAPVPLPAPFALLLGGLAMMGAMSRRKSEDASKA